MACQKYTSKVGNDTNVKVVYKASSIPTPVCSIEQKDVEMVLCILPSLSCHLYLVCVPFAYCPNLFMHFKNIFILVCVLLGVTTSLSVLSHSRIG